MSKTSKNKIPLLVSSKTSLLETIESFIQDLEIREFRLTPKKHFSIGQVDYFKPLIEISSIVYPNKLNRISIFGVSKQIDRDINKKIDALIKREDIAKQEKIKELERAVIKCIEEASKYNSSNILRFALDLSFSIQNETGKPHTVPFEKLFIPEDVFQIIRDELNIRHQFFE